MVIPNPFVRLPRGATLTITPQYIDVTSGHPSANEHWTHTDSAGHAHRYDRGYPTLDLVVDAEHWCEGDEGIAPHDSHMAVDEGHYECKLCREVIKPTMDPAGMPKSIIGEIEATLTGLTSSGVVVEMWLMPDEADRIAADPAAVEDVLDNAPHERIISMRHGG
jgi:hypothetical protein